MEVEILEDEAQEFVANLLQASDVQQVKRASTPGFHASGLLFSLMQETKQIPMRVTEREGESTQDRSDFILRTTTGLMWEDMLGEHAFGRERLGLPIVLNEDGIIGTPDDFDTSLWEPLEYKATWTSSNRSILERWYWLHQMRLYSYMTGATTAKLKVLYLCGNWKPPKPMIQIYRLHWRSWEPRETWEMLLQHKRILESRGLDRI